MPTSNSSITFRVTAEPVVRYASGSVIFDEALRDGRLTTRYWNTAGQVWPEMHIERQRWGQDEPADTFALAVGGQDLAGGWSWLDGSESPDPTDFRGAGRPVRHAVIRLFHAARKIEVAVHARIDGGPFLLRWLEIVNRSDHAQAITAVAPWAGMLWNHRVGENLPADDPQPFQAAWNHLNHWGNEGDFWFEELRPGRLTEDGGRHGRSGWSRPSFWARNRCTGQTVVCELGWSGNWAFTLDHLTNTATDRPSQPAPWPRWHKLFFRMGLAGHEAALRVLLPGESVTTPVAHLGFFQADDDAIVQACHDHVLHVVTPAPVPGRIIEIEANHRGYLCDRESEDGLKRDVEVAKSIGTELYTVDAGWYGRPPNTWFNAVGDWEAGPWLPNGLEPVVEQAHRHGMRFGLWVEIEAAGANSALKERHPDWLMTRDGQLVANGRALDLSKPEVAAWCEAELNRLIIRYRLDMYRIDHNHCLEPMGNHSVAGVKEDLGWRYYDAFDAMFKRLHAAHPTVVLQNCAGGGGRLDWGTMHRFHNAEQSDSMRQPRSLKILNGLTMALPPALLMRSFGTETGELMLDGDVDSQLRSALICRPIFRGIAPSCTELSPWLADRIAHHCDLFRRVLRPLLLDCKVYHHTPFLHHEAADSWLVLEYASPDRTRAVAAIFRQAPTGTDTYHFFPRGLDAGRRYRVRSDNHDWSYEIAGSELIQQGLRVRLERPLSSELLILAVLP